MYRIWLGAVALAVAAVALHAPEAAAQRVKTGVLNCSVSAGFGLIIGSQKTVQCFFRPDRGGPDELYEGTITKFGLDIGATAAGQMVWAVYNEGGYGPYGLAGDYAGATGEATVAVGLGANVLVGGSSRTIALQPVSVSGQVGLNLAIGVGNLSLRPSR